MTPATAKKNRIRAAQWRKDHPLKWAFFTQRQNARRRGIKFLFSFAEWLQTWGAEIERRGNAADELCMSRIEDKGPYSPDNIQIITNRENNFRQHLYG